MLLATPFLLFAVGCLLLAVRFLFLAAYFSFLVTRPLAARCVKLTAPCSLFLTRHSRPNYRFCLLASCRPLIAARPRGLFIPARGVLFASYHVNLLLTDARRSLQSAYYSDHSTLITSRTFFLVARRSLFEICCFLLADRFALLSSCFSLLFASHTVLVTRILLLADCCFLFLFFLIEWPKLFTLMTLNVTPFLDLTGWDLIYGSTTRVKYFKNNSFFCTLFKQLTADRCPLLDLATGHLRLIISSRCSFIAVICSLIVFRIRSKK